MKKPTLSNFVVTMRTQRGWSQAHLAEASGVSTRTLQRLEGGGRVSLETMKALAAAFDIGVESLVQLQEPVVAGQEALPVVLSGVRLAEIIGAAFALRPGYDETASVEELERIGEFLETCRDWMDIWEGLGPGDRARAAGSLDQDLAKLMDEDWLVFAQTSKERISFGAGKSGEWPVATIQVCRASSPSVRLDPTFEALLQEAAKREKRGANR